KNAVVRLRDHWCFLAKGTHENRRLQRAWDKYGSENFSSYIVEQCSLEQRWVREQWWIDKLCAADRSTGFNIMHSVQGLLPSKQMSKILKDYWHKRWQDPEYAQKRTEELKGLSKKL